MGIQINQYVCTQTAKNDLASIREEILTAAREAKVNYPFLMILLSQRAVDCCL